jgi:hypothetical protein
MEQEKRCNGCNNQKALFSDTQYTFHKAILGFPSYSLHIELMRKFYLKHAFPQTHLRHFIEKKYGFSQFEIDFHRAINGDP